MDIHSYDTSNHVICMCVLGWRSQQKVSSEETCKSAELPCLMISSGFPGTFTDALEILLNITPIEEFFLAEVVRWTYRITASGLWRVNRVGSFGKTKSHVDACNEVNRFLTLLQMLAHRIKKTKVFERNFECQIMDNKKNVIRSESVLNQNTVKVFTDCSKLYGSVSAGFYAECPNNSPKPGFFPPWNLQYCVSQVFPPWIYSTVSWAKVLAIPEASKSLLLEKLHNQGIVVLVDSQAAIKAPIKYTVTSITVFNCIRNLNQLGKQNHVSIAWIPGPARIHGNKMADYTGSKSNIHGPKPFITVPNASCVSTVKDWSTDIWKSMWNKQRAAWGWRS